MYNVDDTNEEIAKLEQALGELEQAAVSALVRMC
jgi:hypothetical protein